MKKLTTQKIIATGLLITTILLLIVSCLILPDTVITQFSIGKSSPTTMPKWIAVLIPTVFGAGSSVYALLNKKEDRKSLIISAVGIAIFIIMMIVNR
ncbi:MAG: hypothetical protein Q4F95_09380 [Oscillospiraceae bacterium]|nr:hypothetical protein [Oscillospiraceae bacterium]